MQKQLMKIISCLSCFTLLGCLPEGAKAPSSADDSEQKFVLVDGRENMNLEVFTKNITEAKIAIAVNLEDNVAFTLNKGVVQDVFPVLTGRVITGLGGLICETRVGVTSVHILDHCPEWYSATTDTAAEPCGEDNSLGWRGLWHRAGVLYGVHGRYPYDLGKQNFIYNSSADSRRVTRGCIVAPHDRLIKLFNMILSDPVFSGPEFASDPGGLHPGAKMLKEFGKGNVLKNRAISLIDINDKSLGGVKNVVGESVKLDVRVVVIDTREYGWLSREVLLEKNPIFDLFSDKKSAAEYKVTVAYRMVTDCIAEESVPIYKSSLSFMPTDKVMTVAKGAKLKRLYRWPLDSDASVQVDLSGVGDVSKGWIKNLDGFKCSEDYYSTSERAKIEISK